MLRCDHCGSYIDPKPGEQVVKVIDHRHHYNPMMRAITHFHAACWFEFKPAYQDNEMYLLKADSA